MAEMNAFVSGNVQGVGYRYFVLHRAKALGLRGFVRNHEDGSVEIVAQGPRERLEMLLEELRKGPSAGRVDRARAEWRNETKSFDGFSIEP